MKSARIRVKMCGMTRSEDIAHAVNLGIDAVGLIFYPQSARYVSLEMAKTLLKSVPPFVDVVAVLVNPEKVFVDELLDKLPIHLLQFHGDESATFCEQFKKPYIKAIHPDSTAFIRIKEQEFSNADALLLDTPSNNARGGTGVVFDWTIIPKQTTKPYILAGGLSEYNILDALASCAPYAVDLCSGVESEPGVKDQGKMNRFMEQFLKY